MTASLDSIDAAQLTTLLTQEPSTTVIDVRTPAEFAAVHIPGSYNVPLEVLAERGFDLTRIQTSQIVLVCQSANRAIQAQQFLVGLGLDAGTVLTGGIRAYERSGGRVIRETKRWAMDRQVRMAAGSLVLLGFVASKLINPKLAYLSAAVGAGLTYSAASDSCAMAAVLSKMPWNTVVAQPEANPLGAIPRAGQQLSDTGR